MARVSNESIRGYVKRPLTTAAGRGRDAARWRTVDLAIPQRVAPLQSPRLFRQARLRMSCEAPSEFGADRPTALDEALERVSKPLVVDTEPLAKRNA